MSLMEELSTKDELYRQIILNKDINQLLALDESDKQDFLLCLMYDFLCNMELNQMNHAQQTLFLAMRLEDTCQADSLPSLSEEEEVFLALPKMQAALEELGAPKTAALIGELIAIVPEGTVPEWEWFFSGEQEKVIDRLDGEITDYPDGVMAELYIAYISKPEVAAEVLSGLNA